MNETKLREIILQKVCELKFPAELKMFCRDCQNALINLLQKYNALKTANANVLLLLDESRQEAKSWETVYNDLVLVMKETTEVLDTLRKENNWNGNIIEEWEERRRGQYDNI